MPVLPDFDFFRSVWGIRGRRNDIVRVRATIRFEGIEEVLTVNEHGEPDEIRVRRELDAAGKKIYSVFGPAEKVEAKRIEIAQKCGPIEWEECKVDTLESLVEMEFDLTSATVRRLAAKIALERFSQIRGHALLIDDDFKPLREFVLKGYEKESCCGLLSDTKLLSGSLNIPLPNHGVFLIAHPLDRILGGIVTFFGLFFYWVVLSRRYTALAAWDDFWFENPQFRETHNPPLRSGTGSVRVLWTRLEDSYRADPYSAVSKATQYATDKFRSAVDRFYGQSPSEES